MGLNLNSTSRSTAYHNMTLNRFYMIRWVVVVCCFQQLFVFAGYLTDCLPLIQLAWNSWIPLALFCLTILSIRFCESYIQIRSLTFQINKKHIYGAYTAWICASVFNWTGTLCGVSGYAPVPQVFFYATWKLLASVCLSGVAWIVLQVRNATKDVYNSQIRRDSLDVRYKPKSTNIGEDIIDSVKCTKMTIQRSFTNSIKKHSKNNSVSISESGNNTPGTKRGLFEMPDLEILPPVLNDDTDKDPDLDSV